MTPPRSTLRTTSTCGRNTCAGSTRCTDPIITKELVDYWCLCGTPDQLRDQTQLMLDAGVDMIGVMLANPFTAQRDIADIGASILA